MISKLDQIGRAYWEAFYNGMMAVGLKPEERPKYSARGHTESEMKRCLRVAMETLRKDIPDFDRVFPEPITVRKAPRTANDEAVRTRAKMGFE